MIIEIIKSSISILDALELYSSIDVGSINTRKKRFNICCPFHNDRNPSFTIYTDTNRFRCWSGCNEGKTGDVIDLVALSLNTSKSNAIKILRNKLSKKHLGDEFLTELKQKMKKNKLLADIHYNFEQEVKEAIDTLSRLDRLISKKLTQIKTIEHLNKFGDLYHLKPTINYWLDSLLENDVSIVFYTLKDAKTFLERLNYK
ncbi:CHC2 zinc finger domain-containing protein [Priestia megaterium]|uniref:CHC2 zinc finger domain-containing protein n=1 Tax=Priestia megaterium TaxID=1404 RepID=UPI002877F2CC|nr:CHC2 zinc finger domain-containing protein [Priestia megaterium]